MLDKGISRTGQEETARGADILFRGSMGHRNAEDVDPEKKSRIFHQTWRAQQEKILMPVIVAVATAAMMAQSPLGPNRPRRECVLHVIPTDMSSAGTQLSAAFDGCLDGVDFEAVFFLDTLPSPLLVAGRSDACSGGRGGGHGRQHTRHQAQQSSGACRR